MLIIDPMHNLYLGTAKNIFRFWRNSDIIDEHAVRVVNSRISQLIVPSSVRFSLPASIESTNSDPSLHPAKVHYFAIHFMLMILHFLFTVLQL